MKRIRTTAAFLLVFVPTALWADAAGDGWLAKMDDAMRAAKNSHGTQTMILIDKDGTRKERVIESWQEGDRSLARFRKPAAVACVGFLVLSPEEMYIYMPSFGKIRRIASHVRNQSFMGSDFSYNDMSRKRIDKEHTATVQQQDDATVTLKVVPKEGAEDDYDSRIVVLDKKTLFPRTIRFRKEGKDVKKMTVLGTEVVDGVRVITKVQMENLETGHKTIMEMKYDAVNKGVPRRIFSKRKLQRCK